MFNLIKNNLIKEKKKQKTFFYSNLDLSLWSHFYFVAKETSIISIFLFSKFKLNAICIIIIITIFVVFK